MNARLQPIQTRILQCKLCSHSVTLWDEERKPLALTYTNGNEFSEIFAKNLLYQQSELLAEKLPVESSHNHCGQIMYQITTINNRNNILFIDLDSISSHPRNPYHNLDDFENITIGATTYTILAVIHNKNSHFTTTFKICNERFSYDDQNGKITKETYIEGSRLAAALFVKIP